MMAGPGEQRAEVLSLRLAARFAQDPPDLLDRASGLPLEGEATLGEFDLAQAPREMQEARPERSAAGRPDPRERLEALERGRVDQDDVPEAGRSGGSLRERPPIGERQARGLLRPLAQSLVE